MYERKRRAIDVAGQHIELVERLEFTFGEKSDRAAKPPASTKMFSSDGQPLIDEGDGFFRNPFGGRYKLTD